MKLSCAEKGPRGRRWIVETGSGNTGQDRCQTMRVMPIEAYGSHAQHPTIKCRAGSEGFTHVSLHDSSGVSFAGASVKITKTSDEVMNTDEFFWLMGAFRMLCFTAAPHSTLLRSTLARSNGCGMWLQRRGPGCQTAPPSS